MMTMMFGAEDDDFVVVCCFSFFFCLFFLSIVVVGLSMSTNRVEDWHVSLKTWNQGRRVPFFASSFGTTVRSDHYRTYSH